jgi:hypothetical protein
LAQSSQHLLWDQRNTNCHGINAATKSASLREQALQEIEILHINGQSPSETLTNIYERRCIPFRSQGNMNYIRHSINTHQDVITKSAKEAKTKFITNVCILFSHFLLWQPKVRKVVLKADASPHGMLRGLVDLG